MNNEDDEDDDHMFEKALEFVLATKHASASMLQRKFKLGYTRAARLIDLMEERGYIGPNDGRKAREVYGSAGSQYADIPNAHLEDDPLDAEGKRIRSGSMTRKRSGRTRFSRRV